MEKSKKSNIYILMVIATVFWGGAFVAGKYNAASLTPAMITFLRFLFASLIMVPLMLKVEKKENYLIGKSDIKPLILATLTGMVGYHLLFFTSLKYTTAINSSLIGASNPIISYILAAIFVGEKIDKKRIGIIILAFFGVFMTIIDWNFAAIKSMSFNVGDLYMLCAVLCFGSYMVIIKVFKTSCSTTVFSAYMFVFCTLIMFPIVLYQGFGCIKDITVQGWTAILYMAIFPTVIGYMIQQKSIKEIGVAKTSLFINLVPISSMILASVILSESISVTKILSAAIIILAVYLNSKIKA